MDPASPPLPPPARSPKVMAAVTLSVIGAIGLFSVLLFTLPQQGPHPAAAGAPVVTVDLTLQSNPTPSLTSNGGGWRLEVTSSVGGTVALADLSVEVRQAPATTLARLDPLLAPLQGNGSAHWYAQLGQRGSGGCRYVPDQSSGAHPCTSEVPLASLPTLEGVSVVLADVDADGRLSRGDYVLVFADSDGDGALEVPDGILLLQDKGDALVGTSLA